MQNMKRLVKGKVRIAKRENRMRVHHDGLRSVRESLRFHCAIVRTLNNLSGLDLFVAELEKDGI